MTSDYGEVQIKFGILEGPSANVTKEFLRKLVRRIVVRSTKYFDEAQYAGEPDHVFIYGEKQFHSVVCPAVADITPYFLMENPLYRKPPGEEEYSGSVDYWVFYKNYSFMIELKHSYFAYTQADNPGKDMAEKFLEALQQLEEIRKDECRSLTYGNGLRKIALETIVFYRESEEESKLKADVRNENFRMLFKKLLRNTELRNKSNFRALWILNKKLVTPIKYADTSEIYPAIAFVGYVSDIVN
jgi:hypothetical protein